MYKLTLNDREISIDKNETDRFFKELEGKEFAEVWYEGKSTKLCLLLNAKRCFFMFMKEDDSFISFDANESDEDYEDFYLSNGQLDEYPKNMTVERSFYQKVFEHYFLKEERSSDIQWIEG